MATVNYGDMNKQKRFDNFVIQFKDKNQREPTVVEIETVKKMIEESSL